MDADELCALTNGTSACSDSGSSAGLAVGLTLFFLLLVIAVGLVLYKQRSRIAWQLGRGQRPAKKDFTETPQTDEHHYTSLMKDQLTPSPVYENLSAGATGQKRTAGDQRRFPSEPADDLYLQCDSQDDAIYSNDPMCSLAILPESQEDDLYVMPDI